MGDFQVSAVLMGVRGLYPLPLLKTQIIFVPPEKILVCAYAYYLGFFGRFLVLGIPTPRCWVHAVT